MLDKDDVDTFYCDECHLYKNKKHMYTRDSKQLCAVCYYYDNIGTACEPGQCDYQGCVNNSNKETVNDS